MISIGPPPEAILMHCYRSDVVDGVRVVDKEGERVAEATALFLKEAYENNDLENTWYPIVLVSADWRRAFDGVPLSDVYIRDLQQRLSDVGLDYGRFVGIRNGHNIGFGAVGTRSELIAFDKYLKSLGGRDGDQKPLGIARAPHLPRIRLLAERLGLDMDFLSVEGILKYKFPEMDLKATFPDWETFMKAESRKLLAMKIDRTGFMLELVGKLTPKLKNVLLNVIGHRLR